MHQQRHKTTSLKSGAMWRDMALLSDKQFAALAVAGGLAAWWLYRKSTQLVEATGEAVSDSVWWYGHQVEKAGEAIERIGMDDFDSKYRHTEGKLMNDAQYARWKAAVQSGQLTHPKDR